MPRPVKQFVMWLKTQPLSNAAKVQGYLYFLSSKEGFAMVKSRTIAEDLEIDSNLEVVRCLKNIGATDGSRTFKDRVVPGFHLPLFTQSSERTNDRTLERMDCRTHEVTNERTDELRPESEPGSQPHAATATGARGKAFDCDEDRQGVLPCNEVNSGVVGFGVPNHGTPHEEILKRFQEQVATSAAMKLAAQPAPWHVLMGRLESDLTPGELDAIKTAWRLVREGRRAPPSVFAVVAELEDIMRRAKVEDRDVAFLRNSADRFMADLGAVGCN